MHLNHEIVVKNQAATTIMGGLRSAGLAGRLIRKHRQVRRPTWRFDQSIEPDQSSSSSLLHQS